MIQHQLFNQLTDSQKELFFKIWQEKNIQKDTILLKESQKTDKVFILLKGKLAAIKETLYGDDYITTIVETSDEIFGDISLIDKGSAITTIKAETDCVILETTHDKFYEFMEQYPNIGYKILLYISKSLAKYLRKADKDVITLFNALVEVVEND